jgi:hypothetical protein
MTYQPPLYQPPQGNNVANQIGAHSYDANGGNVNPSNYPGVATGKAIATQVAIMAAKHYGPKLAKAAFGALRSTLR